MRPAIRSVAMAMAMLLLARPAFAYIGPGAGLGVLAAFWALLTAVISSIAFLVLWPLRNRLRRRRNAAERHRDGPAGASDAERPGG